MKNNPETIDVPVWWVRSNGTWLRRECLDPKHPESTYNYIKNKLNLVPENYGYYEDENIRFKTEEYMKLDKQDLVEKIIELENEIEGYMKAGF